MSFFLYKPYIPPQNLSLQEWFPLKKTHGLLSGLPILGAEKITRLYKKFSKLHELRISFKQ